MSNTLIQGSALVDCSIAGSMIPASFTFTPAAGAANVCDVVIQAVDSAGNAMAGVFSFDVFLSDAATGVGLTGTSASGTVTAKSASGAVVGTYTAKKALRVQSLATGAFTLEVTDSAKTAFYPAVVHPTTGRAVVGDALATADYGS